jgi:hypothetical protein
MPMSEEERRLLHELELRLIADDPHLAMELLSGYPARRLPARLFAGLAACLPGFVVLLVGIGSQAAAAVVLGLLLLGAGALVFLDRPFPGRGRRREQPAG